MLYCRIMNHERCLLAPGRLACMPDHIIFWGTYDKSRPRTTILINGARLAHLQVTECHSDIWGRLEDKSSASLWHILARLLFCLAAYPRLVARYMRLPRHAAVIVLYPGMLDLLILWPWARLRRVALVYDTYLPLYEMLVEDRRLLRDTSMAARMLQWCEAWACRRADLLLLDTAAHARYLSNAYGIAPARMATVFVGAESACFTPAAPGPRPATMPFTVLFYGQFIPLHGMDTIISAAAMLAKAGEQVQFVLIGTGQEASRIDAMIAALGCGNIRRIPWVAYEELQRHIHAADICLGIFGTGGKAGRVIPNKVFQVMACGRPLITRDSEALRELGINSPLMRLTPAGDAAALMRAILSMREIASSGPDAGSDWRVVDESVVGGQLALALRAVLP
jgi:glycosyltransferase involved in cell wall biosynthesis